MMPRFQAIFPDMLDDPMRDLRRQLFLHRPSIPTAPHDGQRASTRRMIGKRRGPRNPIRKTDKRDDKMQLSD
jgi:hypothetical protein